MNNIDAVTTHHITIGACRIKEDTSIHHMTRYRDGSSILYIYIYVCVLQSLFINTKHKA